MAAAMEDAGWTAWGPPDETNPDTALGVALAEELGIPFAGFLYDKANQLTHGWLNRSVNSMPRWVVESLAVGIYGARVAVEFFTLGLLGGAGAAARAGTEAAGLGIKTGGELAAEMGPRALTKAEQFALNIAKGNKAEQWASEQLGVARNFERLSAAGTRKRVPDFVLDDLFVEVKNRGEVAFSSQLRDLVRIAQAKGKTLEVWIRPGTRVFGPLLEAEEQELLRILRKLPF